MLVLRDRLGGDVQFFGNKNNAIGIGVWVTGYDTHLVAGLAFDVTPDKK